MLQFYDCLYALCINSLFCYMVRFFIAFLLLVSNTIMSLHIYGADITVKGSSDKSGKQTVSISGIQHDNSKPARDFIAILKNDLTRSGWFIPTDAESASITISGTVREGRELSANINVSWMLASRQFNWTKNFQQDMIRDAAHSFSDLIVQRILNKPPMASSKIILVGKRGRDDTEIYVCDYDGARLQQVTSDGKLCMSPKWVPDKNAFLYTSWLTGASTVYKVDLKTKTREAVSSFPGLNNGAAISPNGEFLAIVLSRSGGVDIYVKSFETQRYNRITNSKSVNESSPSWSPNSSSIVYVSDETSSPQLYIMNKDTKQERRAVYGMRESVSPDWGANGLIAFCGREDRYRIYVMDPNRKEPKLVSPDDNADYEDPSWAPDGRHIVCTRTVNYKKALVILDTMGDPAVPLISLDGDWFLSNWSNNRTVDF